MQMVISGGAGSTSIRLSVTGRVGEVSGGTTASTGDLGWCTSATTTFLALSLGEAGGTEMVAAGGLLFLDLSWPLVDLGRVTLILGMRGRVALSGAPPPGWWRANSWRLMSSILLEVYPQDGNSHLKVTGGACTSLLCLLRFFRSTITPQSSQGTFSCTRGTLSPDSSLAFLCFPMTTAVKQS